MEILRVENLTFSYPSQTEKALDGVSFSVERGDFILLCGHTGSGKTTLLKLLKKEIAPFGEKMGAVYFSGQPLEKTEAGEIGFVLQNPENQIVCDKVWHELAFGLENLGVESSSIRRKVAEMASYFGISDWFYRNTDELSGGQKQLLNLACVMLMSPKLLLLDEPTAQLDPIAAVDFLTTLRRINRDFGTTVIITEHRTQEIFSLADKVMIMENGKVISYDAPSVVCKEMRTNKIFGCFPSSALVWNETGAQGDCPLDIIDGKNYIEKHFANDKRQFDFNNFNSDKRPALSCKNLCFRYSKDSENVISDLSLSVNKGEVHSILGANGEGKTTLLKLLCGVLKPYKGKIIFDKNNDRQKISMLSQNVQLMFLKDSVKSDFENYLAALGVEQNKAVERIMYVTQLLNIDNLVDKHPFDLSGGEQQKCAIAKVLLSEPDIILMDEPVKSLDAFSKKGVADIISNLKSQGITVIMVTHDLDFAAEVSDRCSLLFNGETVSCDVPCKFFSDNNFYTTAASRISREYYDNAVTYEQIVKLCLKNKRKD